MNETAFVEKREKDWQRLNQLCVTASSTTKVLSTAELVEFVRLYRKVAQDLAILRTKSANQELTAFLNSLVGQAYGILYSTPKKSVRTAIVDALRSGAQTMRRRKVFVLASLGIFLAGWTFAFAVLQLRPDLRDHLVNGEVAKIHDVWTQGKFNERTAAESASMTAFYSTNNPRVSILSGSVAASTFGVGTAYLMWSNGQMLGALSSDMKNAGRLGTLFIWIAPHGASELSGAIVAGGAGLCLGWALINPGRRRRGDALREAGKDGFVLLVMGVVMMFIAAPFEGFFSFNPLIPDAAKLIVGLAVFSAWMLYWSGYARDAAQLGAN